MQISKTIGDRQKIWVDAVQKRIALTSSMLADMRSVKMMGLSRMLTSMIQDQRVSETYRMAGYRWSIVWQNVVQNLPWALAPALTFAVYAIQATVQGTESIGTTKAFASLSIITLLTNPAAKLLSAVPSTASSVGCFDRIQKFLVTPPREDHRHIHMPSSNSCRVEDSNRSTIDDVELACITLQRSDHEHMNNVAVSVTDADFRPVGSAGLILRNITFSAAPGSLTMIIGPVASGKTTLLKAILGEVACVRGSVSVMSPRIAFCAQTPWLPNFTIRQAICATKSDELIDEDWYRTVLQACALDHDISLFLEGDQTQIGSGSTILSGGQKNRVALARAVYARGEVVILDNVLSALDTITKETVLERLFGKRGLFRKLSSTVLFATDARQYLLAPSI